MSARSHKSTISSENFRNRLKLKQFEVVEKLHLKHPHVEKFFEEKNLDPGKIRDHSAKILGAGAIAGFLFLNSPSQLLQLPPAHEIIEKLKIKGLATQPRATLQSERKDEKKFLVNTFKSFLPERPRPLDRNEEKFLERIFENVLGVSTRGTLEGEHLNTTYGYIGAEQHLRRYPGDRLKDHADVLKAGMAPGLGAWGYFASSKEDLRPDLEEIEKWYGVVQTLYLPDWHKRLVYLRDWYKYRKVLIVDTLNGNAVVAAIADSGPAAWTGKHFGGSPEVMEALGGSNYKKGPVIVFFVDDPENKVLLGPVEYNE